MSELPKEVSRGTVTIGDIEVEVINLDNGQRLISAESMERFLEFFDGSEMKNVTPEGEA